MSLSDKCRIDKFLWAVRVFKTRNIAAEACKKGRIIIEGIPVKPSREVKHGDIIFVRKLPVVYTFRVIQLPGNRIPAQRVPEYIENMTSVEELHKLKIRETVFYSRQKGTGRPTKKERRLLDKVIRD
ncbi:MAG: RNA-binding S4 domain-containing protein [Bacteroidales bacterium]|nr:RNA-binding S4 domain-containing protein [Bacteroidales bacterium]